MAKVIAVCRCPSHLFSEDLAGLEEKISYLNYLNEAGKIADPGHEHLIRYHTSAGRARQVLGYPERYLVW